jgi:hypothetical protein
MGWSSATLKVATGRSKCNCLNGLAAPLGVTENTSDKGYLSQYHHKSLNEFPRTMRASRGFTFRAVRGVLPRNFPGVLKISATFLCKQGQRNSGSIQQLPTLDSH